LVTSLETGVVRADFPDGSPHYFMVSGGFLEVADDEVRILADVGEEDSAIDLARATKAADRAKQRMRASGSKDFDLARAEASLARAVARLRVGELKGRRGVGPTSVG
jgi:F-type H+-transporting ATPase subunit epsilon